MTMQSNAITASSFLTDDLRCLFQENNPDDFRNGALFCLKKYADLIDYSLQNNNQFNVMKLISRIYSVIHKEKYYIEFACGHFDFIIPVVGIKKIEDVGNAFFETL